MAPAGIAPAPPDDHEISFTAQMDTSILIRAHADGYIRTPPAGGPAQAAIAAPPPTSPEASLPATRQRSKNVPMGPLRSRYVGMGLTFLIDILMAAGYLAAVLDD